MGGGAAGLAAARELAAAGHAPTVLEASDRVGGVWDYRDAVEPCLLGDGSAAGPRLHASMYAGLRTNLPREVMGFQALPFDAAFPGAADPRQFCSHEEARPGAVGCSGDAVVGCSGGDRCRGRGSAEESKQKRATR